MMESTETKTLHLPADEVNLKKWLYECSDKDYQSFSRGHRAMGAFKYDDGVPGLVNVEQVGGMFCIQHYREEYADATRTRLYSNKTKAYVFRIFPVTISACWEMRVQPLSKTESQFTCHIEVGFPNRVLERLARIGLGSLSLRSHNKEETKNFAADIERKSR